MSTTTRRCSFCYVPGHNIRTCNDVRISNAWRNILSMSNIQRGSLLNDEHLVHVRQHLLTLPPLLLTCLAVKCGQCRSQESIETKIDHICTKIYTEAGYFEQLSLEDKRVFLDWIDPDIYPLEDDTDDETDDDMSTDDDMPELISDDDGFIPFNDAPTISTHFIEPILLCLESAQELGKNSECPICFEEDTSLLDMDTTECQHSFCHSCITKHLHVKHDCPMCRNEINTLQVRNKENYDEIYKLFGCITRTQEDTNQINHGGWRRIRLFRMNILD